MTVRRRSNWIIQQSLSICLSCLRPRWTRDFMPDNEIPHLLGRCLLCQTIEIHQHNGVSIILRQSLDHWTKGEKGSPVDAMRKPADRPKRGLLKNYLESFCGHGTNQPKSTGCSKGPPVRPQERRNRRRTSQYVEDFFESRTKLEDIFNILSEADGFDLPNFFRE